MGYAARKNQHELDTQLDVWQSPDPIVPEEPPSYFDAGVEAMWAEDSSVANINAEERFFGERNDTIAEMIDSGEVSEELADKYTKVVGYDSDLNEEYTGMDYDGLAVEMNKNGYKFEASDDRMIETMASERYAREELFSRGDALESVAWVAGGVWAATKDPAVLASMLIPVGGAYRVGESFLRNMTRFVGLHGTVSGASELPLQKEIFDFKQRIDSDYGVGDVMMNVGFAAFAGGMLGGSLDTIASRKLASLDGGVRGTMFDGAPDDMTVGEAADLVKQAEAAIDAGNAIDKKIAEVADTPAPQPKIKPTDNIIFHGTDAEFDEFDLSRSADGTIWFTDSREAIEGGTVAASGKGRIVERIIDESELNLAGWDEIDKYSVNELISQGFDGVKMPDDGEITYQIFNPEKLRKLDGVEIPSTPDIKPSHGANIRDDIGFNNIEPDDIPDAEIIMREDGVGVPYSEIKAQAAIEVEAKQGRVKSLMECLKRG